MYISAIDISRVGPGHVGSKARVIILRPFKPVFFKLLPMTELATQ